MSVLTAAGPAGWSWRGDALPARALGALRRVLVDAAVTCAFLMARCLLAVVWFALAAAVPQRDGAGFAAAAVVVAVAHLLAPGPGMRWVRVVQRWCARLRPAPVPV